jgi:Ca-activated chloride channel family protein
MIFSRPFYLLAAILALAIFSVFQRRAAQAAAKQAISYSNLDFMLAALRPPRTPSRLLFATWFLGALLLAFACGGVRLWARVPLKDAVVFLCIDTSGSMRARDVSPSRARAAQTAARAFIDAVPPGTQIGIITFATNAFLIQAPTADLDTAREALTRVPMPNGATAIGDALTLANAQMPAHGRRVVLLLTDGINNRGSDPIAAAQELGKKGSAVYTIGIGTQESGELISGTNEQADLNEDALRAIAQNAGGTYAPVHDAATLRGAFKDLAHTTVWEKRSMDMSLPSALAGGALLLAALLTATALGRLP